MNDENREKYRIFLRVYIFCFIKAMCCVNKGQYERMYMMVGPRITVTTACRRRPPLIRAKHTYSLGFAVPECVRKVIAPPLVYGVLALVYSYKYCCLYMLTQLVRKQNRQKCGPSMRIMHYTATAVYMMPQCSLIIIITPFIMAAPVLHMATAFTPERPRARFIYIN